MNTVKALCDGLAIPRSLAGLQDGSGEEDDTDRRQFLGGTLSVLAAAALGGGLEDERLLMATSLSYRQLEQRTPARALIQPVTAHLSLARDLARRASGSQQARLSAAVSEAAGLAAWLHADQADAAQARRFYKMSSPPRGRPGTRCWRSTCRAASGSTRAPRVTRPADCD